MKTATEKKPSLADVIAKAIYASFQDEGLIGADGANMTITYAVYRVSKSIDWLKEEIEIRNRIEQERNDILKKMVDLGSVAYDYWSTGLRP